MEPKGSSLKGNSLKEGLLVGPVSGGEPAVLLGRVRTFSEGPLVADRVMRGGRHARPEWNTAINIANNLIGSGILALPFAFAQTSLMVGIVMLCSIAMCSGYTMLLMCRSCDRCKTFDFRKVATEAFGHRVGVVVEIMMCLNTLGTCMCYCVLVGDFFGRIASFACEDELLGLQLGHPLSSACSFFLSRPNTVFLLGFTVMLPVSSCRDLSALSPMSVVALLTVLYTVSVVAFKYCIVWTEGPGGEEELVFKLQTAKDVRWWIPHGGGFWEAMALNAVAFNCHYNIPRFYQELSPRRTRMIPSFVVGIAITVVLYLAMAVMGYLSFGADTQSDILANYSSIDLSVMLARLSLGVAMLFSYPLVFNKLRTSVHSLLFPGREVSFRAVLVYGILINPIMFAVGAYVTQLDMVLSFNGAINGASVCYIIPAATFLKLDGFNPRREGIRSFARLPLWCIIAGVILLTLGTHSTICKHASTFGLHEGGWLC